MVLHYLANARLPTEKAHGLQIVENCEALAEAGASVTLVAPRRRNTPALSRVDLFDHYGVSRRFAVARVPCLDMMGAPRWLQPVAGGLLALSFAVSAAVALRRLGPGVVYSRDTLPLAAAAMLAPGRRLVYEAHRLARTRAGRALERWCLRRVALAVAVTTQLAESLEGRGAPRVEVLRDGFRARRFQAPGAPETPRAVAEGFVVGYAGRLHTLGMDKGLGTVVAAIARLADSRVKLVVVGGPPDQVEALGRLWRRLGLPEGGLVAAGEVPPAAVPGRIAAWDAAVLPLPWTEHFARHASPLKLFEYMAAGCPVVASALPAIEEVVTHEREALLAPPGDVEAWAAALARLRDDPALRARLGAAARAAAAPYAWHVRAARVLELLSA